MDILRINRALIHSINTINPIKALAHMVCIFNISKMLFFINYMILITISDNNIRNTKCTYETTIRFKIRRIYVTNHYAETIKVVSFGF